MAQPDDTEARLVALETKVAYQDQIIEDLNAAVTGMLGVRAWLVGPGPVLGLGVPVARRTDAVALDVGRRLLGKRGFDDRPHCRDGGVRVA